MAPNFNQYTETDMISVILRSSEDKLIRVQPGTNVGAIRGSAYQDARDEVGAPSKYSFAVGGVQQDDSYVLQDGDTVTFRAVTGEKGA